MKSIKLFAAILIAAALSFAAQAADVTFKATDGQVFGTKNVYQYELYAVGGGYVKVSYINGGDSLFVDGGSLAGRILQALPQLVNITGTNTYIDPSFAGRVVCVSGTSTIALQGSGQQITVADNCAMVTQIQNKAK